jgi:tyrosinase
MWLVSWLEDYIVTDTHEQFNQWSETKRHPEGTGPNATSSNAGARDMIQESAPNLQERLYTVLTSYNNFTAFSNKRWDPNSRNADSIESIHDRIHLAVGRRGHMEYIVLSSFDPIFFLHHSNVDRLTAIWQILHPDSYVTRSEAVESSFTNNIGDIQDATTPLTPFYDSMGRFWTSDGSRETTTFGYEYADTAGFNLSSGGDEEATGKLRETVRRKYGGQSPSTLRRRSRKRTSADMATAEAGRRRFREGATNESGKFVPDISYNSSVPYPPLEAIIKDGHYREWIVNVKVRNSDIHGPSSVLIFLGDVPDSPKDWSNAPNLVGSCALFTMDGVSNPKNEVAGTIPLTGALMKMVSGEFVNSLDPGDVTDYLKKILRFTVAGAGAEVALNPSRMPGLQITVVSARVRNPESEREFPVWEDYEIMFSMT